MNLNRFVPDMTSHWIVRFDSLGQLWYAMSWRNLDKIQTIWVFFRITASINFESGHIDSYLYWFLAFEAMHAAVLAFLAFLASAHTQDLPGVTWWLYKLQTTRLFYNWFIQEPSSLTEDVNFSSSSYKWSWRCLLWCFFSAVHCPQSVSYI